jgi:hypothetical protein
LDYKKIESGDFMVTKNWVHTMVYIDNNLCEADLVKQKVIIINTTDTNFYWFNLPAKIMRWCDLELHNLVKYLLSYLLTFISSKF